MLQLCNGEVEIANVALEHEKQVICRIVLVWSIFFCIRQTLNTSIMRCVKHLSIPHFSFKLLAAKCVPFLLFCTSVLYVVWFMSCLSISQVFLYFCYAMLSVMFIFISISPNAGSSHMRWVWGSSCPNMYWQMLKVKAYMYMIVSLCTSFLLSLSLNNVSFGNFIVFVGHL